MTRMELCTTCEKAITDPIDAVVCGGGARHRHHARCAERAGVCEARACGAIGFRAAHSPDPERKPPRPALAAEKTLVPLVRAPPIAPGEPAWIPARWDGACVNCPKCHGVSPWPASACAYCDQPLEEQAKQDPAWLARWIEPHPPPAVRSVALGVRFMAALHLGSAGLLGTVGGTAWSTTMPVHGDIGEPAQVQLWVYFLPRLGYCLVMALGLNAMVRKLERGSRAARAVLFILCAALATTVLGIPIAALLALPLLFPSSREYFRRVESRRLSQSTADSCGKTRATLPSK